MITNGCESCGCISFKTVLDNQLHQYIEGGKPAIWHYDLRQCTDCGMGFISPKPSWELLQTFYDPGYGCYTAPSDLAREASGLKYKIARLRYASSLSCSVNRCASTLLGRVAEWLTGKVVSYTLGLPLQLVDDASILEVGYGSGSWLLIMSQLGFTNLHGYDIDANLENRRRLEEAGIKTHSGNLLDMAYPDNYFDCIRLEHVVEHLLEPALILTELNRILKPGGMLVMTFPSIRAVSFNLSPLNSALRESPRHLYLHTKESARNFVKRSGFKLCDIRLYSVVLQLEAVINNILRAREIPITLKGFTLLAPIYQLVNVVVRRGEFITLWATK